MTTLLVIAAIVAAIYIYAAVARYYGFKNWYPLCGCKGTACSPKNPSEAGNSAGRENPDPAGRARTS